MQKKRVLSLILALSCTAALLGGCAGNNTSDGNTASGEHEVITMNAPYRNMSQFLRCTARAARSAPTVRSFVKAFEMVKPGEYDAILMDIQMPHMNGYEATKAIRGGRNPLGKTIPIIAMTANAFSDDVQNSIAAGMDAHISKPIILEKTMRGFLTPPPESTACGRTFARNIHKRIASP